MNKINATGKKTILLGWESIRLKIKRDPVQWRWRGKTVVHTHSC